MPRGLLRIVSSEACVEDWVKRHRFHPGCGEPGFYSLCWLSARDYCCMWSCGSACPGTRSSLASVRVDSPSMKMLSLSQGNIIQCLLISIKYFLSGLLNARMISCARIPKIPVFVLSVNPVPVFFILPKELWKNARI